MARALLFVVCLLGAPAGTWAARMEAKEAQEVPWRKGVLFGALLSRGNLDNVALGLQDREVGGTGGKAGPVDAGDPYDRLKSSLFKLFGVGSKVSFGKLVDSLRSRTSVDEVFVRELEALVSARKLQRLSAGFGVEQFIVPKIGDAHGVVIVRYPSHDEQEWGDAVAQILSGVELSQVEEGIFLPYIAQSLTAEEFAKDTRSEVLLMSETCFGSLEEVLRTTNPAFDTRLSLFLRTVFVVQRLNELGIPHRSDISPDNVLLPSDPSTTEEHKVVLSPEILVVEPEYSAEEVWRADIRQLGTLLRTLFSDEFDATLQPVIDVFLAFGKWMESGAFSADFRIADEVDELLHRIAPGVTHDDLVALRLRYLRLAVDAEIPAAQLPEFEVAA